jgi:arylsulfatase A-like enzyme
LKTHPNIILILTDQQSANMMSCAGNKYVKTPNMDRLAAGGVRFERAYCTNPVCVPSRVSMMTGKMPSEFGLWYNQRPFEVDRSAQSSTLGMLMKNSEYELSYGGKIHLPEALKPQNTGFDYFCNDECEGLAHACAAYLKRDHDKPFFLVASFINPHDICYLAIRDFKAEKRDESIVSNATREVAALNKALQLPVGISEEDFFANICPPLPENHEVQSDEPEAVSWLFEKHKFRKNARERASEKAWRMHRWAYAKLTEQVDKEIGILLDGLDKSGHQDNTVVIFTSDHGDHDSAHRLEHKTTLYDEAIKVPLIINSPAANSPGMTNRIHLISNGLDILPTICDYAGVAVPSDLKGLSLKPLAEGNTPDSWRNEVYIESEFGRAIVSQDYKYARYDGGKHHEQLYDRQADPYETRNSANLPKNRQVLKSHQQIMDQYIAQYIDERLKV